MQNICTAEAHPAAPMQVIAWTFMHAWHLAAKLQQKVQKNVLKMFKKWPHTCQADFKCLQFFFQKIFKKIS